MKRDRERKLNLGSGDDYLEGWVNVDINAANADVIADLSKKFPFENDSVSEIKASDILEHFTKEHGEFFLKECYRVLKNGGKIFIRTHNVYQIFHQFKTDPQVLIHFLYGDTSQTENFGSHKYAYTEKSLRFLLKKEDFKILSFNNNATNFEIVAQKIQKISKKLNIGIIMQSPDIGGAEVYMASLISKFIEKGNKVYAASNEGKFFKLVKDLTPYIYKIHLIMDINGNAKGLIKTFILLPYFLYFYVKLLIRFKKESVDVILMSNFTEKLFVTFLAYFFKLPIVWIEYGSLAPVFKRNFYVPKIIYRLLKDIPFAIIVPSKNTKNSLIFDARVSLSKLKLIPCGISISKTNIDNHRSGSKIVIGSLSRMTREKGQEYLIKAIPQIVKRIPNVSFVIAGDGPDRDYFINLSDKLGIKRYVSFPGFVKDKNEFYSGIDIFVFSSVWNMEGFGLVNLEAMANKVPVVASNIEPVREIIIDKKTGFLVDPTNTKELANKVILLAKDINLRNSIGVAGYKRLLDSYTLDKASEKILQVLYESTI